MGEFYRYKVDTFIEDELGSEWEDKFDDLETVDADAIETEFRAGNITKEEIRDFIKIKDHQKQLESAEEDWAEGRYYGQAANPSTVKEFHDTVVDKHKNYIQQYKLAHPESKFIQEAKVDTGPKAQFASFRTAGDTAAQDVGLYPYHEGKGIEVPDIDALKNYLYENKLDEGIGTLDLGKDLEEESAKPVVQDNFMEDKLNNLLLDSAMRKIADANSGIGGISPRMLYAMNSGGPVDDGPPTLEEYLKLGITLANLTPSEQKVVQDLLNRTLFRTKDEK